MSNKDTKKIINPNTQLSNEEPIILNEFKERFQKMDDEQLIATYHEDLKKQGWVSARGRFHAALSEEFEKRGIDITAIRKKILSDN